ncbi:MAG: ATP-binding protein [Bacteroidota bacterium]|nr:ATP-binding protein [Bacteroidota bacterium]
MYSLKVQLFAASFIALLGGAVSFYVISTSPVVGAAAFFLCFLLSFGILYFYIYRPVQKIQRFITAQQEAIAPQRLMVNSSDELQELSDSFNGMLENLKSDIVQMKKLERVRTEFLGNVSHELRTPIFSTQGLLETLLNGAVDDTRVNREFLQRALHNTERLNTLLTELIDISRIESGEMKLRFRFFDVVPFLKSVVDEMQTSATQRTISLSLVGDELKSIDIYGDKERLHQVLVNLIDNAIKYSEPKDRVTVAFHEKADTVAICVEDTGIGIAPQHLPRIFERFYRVDRDRSREVGGTGLGLAIVKHIVEAHNSTIEVDSLVGAGTKFTFEVTKSHSG